MLWPMAKQRGPLRAWSCVWLVVLWTGGTASVTVSAPDSPQTELAGTTVSLVFALSPWPPSTSSVVSFHSPSHKLLCSARWTLDGQPDPSGTSCAQDEPRLSANFNARDEIWFTLVNVQLSDQGDYTLTVKEGDHNSWASTSLVVHAPPPRPTLHSTLPCDTERACMEGNQVELRCSVRDANPPACIVWTRSATTTHTIHPDPGNYQKAGSWQEVTFSVIYVTLRPQDNGATYRCVASNGIDPSGEVAFVPNVKHAPIVELSPCRPGTNYTLVEHLGDAAFTCRATANPWNLTELVRWVCPAEVVFSPTGNSRQYLTLKKPDRGHSGLYSCIATNDQGTGSGDCILDIVYGPVIELPALQSALKESKIILTCRFNANPSPHEVFWSKQNNQTFSALGPTLLIPQVRWEDAGNYTCHVTNRLWPTGGKKTYYTATQTVQVIIEQGPEWLEYALKKFTGRLGSDALLECHTRAEPSPTFRWLRHGVALQTGPGLSIVTSGQGSALHLQSVDRDQLGYYVCIATNRHMPLETELLLSEPGAPDPPQFCRLLGEPGGDQAQLECVLGYEGGATVTLDVVAVVEATATTADLLATMGDGVDTTTGFPQATVTATGLQPETNYLFKVYASNLYGRSHSALEMTMTTGAAAAGPPPPQTPPTDVPALVAWIIGAIALVALLVGLVMAIKVWGIPPIPQKYKDMRARNKEEARMRRECIKQINLEKQRTQFEEEEANGVTYSGKENFAFDDDHTIETQVLPYQTGGGPGGRKACGKLGAPNAEPLHNSRHQEPPSLHQTVRAVGSDRGHNARVPDGFGMGSIDTPHSRQSSMHDGVTDWDMSRDALHFVSLLGEGQFTEVWRVLVSGQDGRRLTVAVKKPKGRCPPEEVEVLLEELESRRRLRTHENILQLLGCCTSQAPVYMVTEFASNGSLLQYLRACRAQGRAPGTWRLTNRDLVVFAMQVAHGMDYLIRCRLLHRDLAARSVLLDHKMICKLSDFGDAAVVVQTKQEDSQRLMAVRWLAPECLYDNLYSAQSDVWAFGVLLWELVTVGATPYPGLRPDAVLDFLAAGYRMERPVQCPPSIYRLMLACWHSDPGQRPGFGVLRERLEIILDTLDREPSRIVDASQLIDFSLPIVHRPSGERC